VILREIDGVLCEPVEAVTIDVSEDYLGPAVEQLGSRRGELQNMVYKEDGTVHLEFLVPTRGLLGFRTDLLTETRGNAVMNTLTAGYRPFMGAIQRTRGGSLVATDTGDATSFGLNNAEARGRLFITPQTEVYAGMVVGEHARDGDLDVNICKKKHLTNMRSSNADEGIRLTPPIQMSLDRALEYLHQDELVEVTPKSIRIRKRVLDLTQRARDRKREETAGVR
jgi:GTP-binding protein